MCILDVRVFLVALCSANVNVNALRRKSKDQLTSAEELQELRCTKFIARLREWFIQVMIRNKSEGPQAWPHGFLNLVIGFVMIAFVNLLCAIAPCRWRVNFAQ